MRQGQRLGIFGGSFNPVHQGHLLLAEYCRETCRLDQVWFVPAATAPHKQGSEAASAEARLDMLKLAVAGHDAFVVSDLEIQRGGVSYTVDTLAALKEQKADDELFFVMGADSLEEFPTWRDPSRICELALPIVVGRPGSPKPEIEALSEYASESQLDEIRSLQLSMPLVEFSSTEIRSRVAEGRSIRYQLPRSVEKYIEANKLYLP